MAVGARPILSFTLVGIRELLHPGSHREAANSLRRGKIDRLGRHCGAYVWRNIVQSRKQFIANRDAGCEDRQSLLPRLP